MEKIAQMMKTRKPLSFRTTQMLYGVSVLLTFRGAGIWGAIA